ncbi:LptF/LptG family permease [Devosia sp.]|uniref:LptF/LptG family permease n=1 Tax=Devosia sp. TaxID=1871048 RepID=UPI002627099E|nr:LptF/LptG family permease [Devosia sp.]
MTRLGTYLLKLFAAEAAALFGVALTILYLVQTLRIVEVGAVRDRGLGTLFWQTILGLPPLSIAFLYVCLAVGLARALRALQTSRELHIIHGSQRLPVLIGTILGYAAIGTLLVLLLAHVIEPAAKRESDLISARAAADLVGRSLMPNRFAELGDGVTITVGGRGADGEITSFFADDRRDTATRRTYIADSALITADELGYVLQLKDGTIQYRTATGQFSEISFQRYDIALERLTGAADMGERRGDQSTYAMVTQGFATGDWPSESLRRIAERTADGFRVLALCLFVAAIAAFPSGRRKEPLLPVEITVLGAVLFERAVTSYAPVSGWAHEATGVVVLSVISVMLLVARLRLFVPMPREAHSA